ncbi:MAG TPA: GAF domain-containing sensor histidine kinase, partial [Thermomicrobiaceae bacterium]|nr:GAF domain-containing sensor histidine kinase [Thermomicrobiaceae bacterium]
RAEAGVQSAREGVSSLQELVSTHAIAPSWSCAPDGGPAAERQSLTGAVDLAARLAGSQRASLLLPDEPAGALRVVAARGLAARLAARVRVRLGDAVAGSVALSRRPLLVNERAVLPAHQARGYLTGAFISVPVPLPDNACGVLSVADPLRPEGFQSDDLHALEQLACQLTSGLSAQQAGRRNAELEQTVQQLRRQVVQVQEAERQRIARDLHDEAGHALTAAVLGLDLELMQLAGDAAATDALRRAREQLVACSSTLHTIAFNLRPRILEDFGLHAALRSLARHAMELTSIEVTVAIEGTPWELDEPHELAILRVVQEALNNARKYARADRVAVALRYEPRGLTLEIEDDGVGLSAQATAPLGQPVRATLGIGGMRERIELVAGSFTIGEGQAGGTRIVAWLPR